MQIKSQPAPAILGQESIHTTLSITHHSQERPSTGPRTLRSSVSPLMSALTTHISNQFREKEKKQMKNSNKWSKAKQKPRKDHLSEKNLGPLRQGQWLDTTEIKCSKIADSSTWGKRVDTISKSAQLKFRWKRAPKCMNASSPLTNAFLPIFLPLMQSSP
jgi:hypothetical protein